MLAEDLVFIQNDMNKSHDELLELIVELRKQLRDHLNYMENNASALTAMSKDYKKLLNEVESLRKDKKELEAALAAVAEKELLKTNEIFGRSSEKISDAFDNILDMEIIDEAETEVIEFATFCSSHKPAASEHNGSDKSKDRGTRKKKQSMDLSKLPAVDRFLLDVDNLNNLYGDGCWRIAHWHKHTSLEHSRAASYAVNYYSPVISIGLEHNLVTIPYNCLLKGSFVSASLMTEIYYQRLFMSNPLYRLEQSFKNFGLNLSRQTMSNWFIRFAFEYFALIVDRLNELMMMIPYHQCDESPLLVIRDGRKAGSKSYIWVHITSELLDSHPIIMFCYELTRGTDHLRKFYEDFEGYITCDAYCSYHTLEKEKQDAITVCGCMMHLRRRFFRSLLVVRKDDLSSEQLDSLPETKALSIISEIYDADEALKSLDASERKEKRNSIVRPLVDSFYSFIDTIDENELNMRARLKDAVNYARNQKTYLCRFLDDGNIPIDDGATERHIRPFAVGRNNFLFCNSVEGAQALATMYTIVETAKANHVNVYLYLRYILEEMPRYMDEKDLKFVDRFLPWSEEYLQYEKTQNLTEPFEDTLNGTAYRPKTPRKTKTNPESSPPIYSIA